MATPHTVAFHTLGCKLNYSETSSIKRMFEEHGYTSVPVENAADIYIINTCSVTDFADKKCRSFVRKVLKTAPQAKVVVIGCYAQLKPKEISEIPGVDLVLGATEKFNILNYIDELSLSSEKGIVKAGELSTLDHFQGAFSFGDRTRSFLKVQDGCDYKCSFCTIPQARGKSRSSSPLMVMENAKEIIAMGVKEIVLTGVNIGDYSYDNKNFLHILKELDSLEGLERIRISSIEPNLCSDEIIEFVSLSKRVVPHFHMPLQSGSDKLLKRMRRRYKSDLYKERVREIKNRMPHCCIGVDVIVGFPGETDADFMDTVLFLEGLDISYLHVFTYSERDNTPAAEMGESVPMETRRKRNAILRSLSEKKKRKFYSSYLSQSRKVLFEQSKSESTMTGFTDNYIKVSLPFDASRLNTINTVSLQSINEEGLVTSHLV